MNAIARHLSIADDYFSDSDSDVYYDPIEYDNTTSSSNSHRASSGTVTPYPTNTVRQLLPPVETVDLSVIRELQTSAKSTQEQIKNLQQKITDIQRKLINFKILIRKY